MVATISAGTGPTETIRVGMPAARELIVLVFYGLRDHHIRCLPARAEAA